MRQHTMQMEGKVTSVWFSVVGRWATGKGTCLVAKVLHLSTLDEDFFDAQEAVAVLVELSEARRDVRGQVGQPNCGLDGLVREVDRGCAHIVFDLADSRLP